ncbi:MAG TPA: ABC transporter substrate-binding protein [Chloroflexota bacterium]|nr:ABC transporter substrate-binding protein [Chloroflexota bacterium]
MFPRKTHLTLAAGVMLALSACGGSAAGSPAPAASSPAAPVASSASASKPAASAAAASASPAAASKPAAADKLKIMVGGLSKQIYLPNMLSERLGYFKEQNLDVQLIDESSGQSSENEVLTGNVDAGSGSYNHTIELQALGKLMETVVQFQVAPGEAEVVAANKADQIKSAADLKGKNLGVTELGSGTHTLTMALLGKAGVPADQAAYVPVGAGDTFLAGLKQGKIDAGMTTEPTISRSVKTGVGKVLVDLRSPEATRAALGGDYPFIGVWMKTDYVNSHKPVVQRLVNAYVKTLSWMSTHSAAEITDKMPQDYYAGDKDLYLTALDGQKTSFTKDGKMPATGPQTVLDIELNYVKDMKGKNIDLAKTYTSEFVDQVKA